MTTFIIMLSLFIAVVISVLLLIRWKSLSANKDGRIRSEESELNILKKRYEEGEISKQEYEDIINYLGSS